jgi:hypothetical protein
MPYYVLRRGTQELYAMNMTLSEEEARRYGGEGETAMVTAIFAWPSSEEFENFRQFLSTSQDEPNSPLRELIEDMRAGRVDSMELSAVQLRDRLRWYQRTGFVAIEPGSEQRVLKIEDFMAELQG